MPGVKCLVLPISTSIHSVTGRQPVGANILTSADVQSESLLAACGKTRHRCRSKVPFSWGNLDPQSNTNSLPWIVVDGGSRRMIVSGWMFLLVPAHPGHPGQRAINCWHLFSTWLTPVKLRTHITWLISSWQFSQHQWCLWRHQLPRGQPRLLVGWQEGLWACKKLSDGLLAWVRCLG